MDHDRFDGLTRSLGAAASRRTLGRALVGGGLGTLFGSAFGAFDADAKKKRHKKKKKQQRPVLNQFGCLDVGQACRGDSALCCSGICEGAVPKKGKKDTSRCVAHGTGGCTADFDGCQTLVIACGTSGFCFRTTGKASFCGGPGGDCITCLKDADCEAGYGPGAACVVCDDCNGNGSTGTACYPAAA